jgi:HlyD family secretion protein
VQEARNRLERAQADFNLVQQKQTSRFSHPEIERVQAAATQAQAAYAAAENALRSSNARAPRAGVVYSLPVRPGQFVNAGDLLVQVADLRTVQVRAFVDEPDIGRLRPGEDVEVTWDALPGRVWRGTLARVPTTILTRGTRNVGEITCTISNADLELLPNVNVNVNVITARSPNALTVAREAVHQDVRGRFVYQVIGDRLERRDVQTAISNLTRVEVTHGLPDNVLVALGSMDGKPLKNGMAVRVVSR